MKIIFSLFLIIFSFYTHSEECYVETFSKVYKLSSDARINLNDLIKKSTCSQEINNQIVQIINKTNGTLSPDFIQKEINSASLKIIPGRISIFDFNTLAKEQLNLESSLSPVDFKTLNQNKTISLNENESLNIECSSCNSLGEKNLKATISDSIKNSERTTWISFKLLSRVKVIKAKHSLNYQVEHLSKEDFYEDTILTSSPENFLDTLENIQFFKVNRSILQGAIINQTDLLPVSLVNFGTPTNVILKTQNINLQRTAIPSRPAKFGEIVELKNTSNGKTISGKVIDYNKVVIEL